MGGGYLKLKDTNTQKNTLNAGTLEEENLVGVYIQNGDDYEKSDTVPESGYILNDEESYCKVDNQEVEVTFSYDTSTKTLNVSPITNSGTKCYLYFDEGTYLKDAILAQEGGMEAIEAKGAPDFNNLNNLGIFATSEGDGRSYYFRGTGNTWVKFAGFYWQIIRINENGSVRLIYNGEATHETVQESNQFGDNTTIGTAQFNTIANYNAYVGYMYGNANANNYDETHANIYNSNIKNIIDEWYVKNLLKFSGYIDKEAGFCGDRQIDLDGTGIGTTATSYGTYIRMKTSKLPTLDCNQNDLYTVKDNNNDFDKKGNEALTYPIGLISADEIWFAGGATDARRAYYLSNGVSFWTMSPSYNNDDTAIMFTVDILGNLVMTSSVDSVLAIRPVINLSADVTISGGNGTISSPYVV